MRPVACSAIAGLVRASIHGAAGSSFVGLLAARCCKALPAPGCHCARSRSCGKLFHHTIIVLAIRRLNEFENLSHHLGSLGQ